MILANISNIVVEVSASSDKAYHAAKDIFDGHGVRSIRFPRYTLIGQISFKAVVPNIVLPVVVIFLNGLIISIDVDRLIGLSHTMTLGTVVWSMQRERSAGTRELWIGLDATGIDHESPEQTAERGAVLLMAARLYACSEVIVPNHTTKRGVGL